MSEQAARKVGVAGLTMAEAQLWLMEKRLDGRADAVLPALLALPRAFIPFVEVALVATFRGQDRPELRLNVTAVERGWRRSPQCVRVYVAPQPVCNLKVRIPGYAAPYYIPFALTARAPLSARTRGVFAVRKFFAECFTVCDDTRGVYVAARFSPLVERLTAYLPRSSE